MVAVLDTGVDYTHPDLAANIWTGKAARIDLETDEIVQLVDSGFTAPFRSLAGLAVYAP